MNLKTEEGNRIMDVTKKQLEKIKEGRRQKFLDNCRKRLSNIAETKLKTTFIGALDAFEKEFGDLWGSGIDEEEKTQEEQEWFDKWQAVRTLILNNGNNQLRALLNEISNHIVEWNRYTTTFYLKDQE
jgi:lipoate-protein ligase A